MSWAKMGLCCAFVLSGSALAVEVEVLVGDIDGMNTDLVPGDTFADMNDFSPEPDDHPTMDRMLVSSAYTPALSSNPYVTSPYATRPSPILFSLPVLPDPSAFVSATLTVVAADIDDAAGAYDMQLFLDGVEIAGAFDDTPGSISGIGGTLVEIVTPLGTGWADVLSDGEVVVVIDELSRTTTNAGVSEAFGIDYALLSLVYECEGVETCDGTDDDCDGVVDEGVKSTYYLDFDLDGYGGDVLVEACEAPESYTEIGGDCDDIRSDVNPGATEIENGVDDNCDGVTDEGTASYDDDGDGFTENDGDCDDGEILVNPAQDEICGDGVDNDCLGGDLLCPTPTPTEIPTPTATEAPTPTATEIPTPTATEAPTPTATEAPTPTATEIPTPTATEAPTPTATEAPTPTATQVPTATQAPTPTATQAPTPTATEAPTHTATQAPTPTATEAPTPTATEAPTPAATASPTPTSPPTEAPTLAPTDAPATPSPTVSQTEGTPGGTGGGGCDCRTGSSTQGGGLGAALACLAFAALRRRRV